MKPRPHRWLLGAAIFLALSWWGLRHSCPLLPSPLALTLVLPAGQPGQACALVASGRTGAGELLYVRYVTPTTVVFGYDSWAVGGPVSPPVAFTPGAARPLLLEMPAFTAPRHVDRRAHGPLRLVWDGREILRGDVHYRGRAPAEIYFGVNPIGGTIANDPFAGQLATAAGHPLHGRPDALFSWIQRLRHWPATEPWAVPAALAAALVGAWLLPPVGRWGWARLAQPPPDPDFAGHPRPPHLAFALTTALGTALFVTVITGFSFRLGQAEPLGQFYDYQAASLLAGRLDVPEAALSSESFLYAGKYYGYFGPTPALLRLPFALAGVGFGRLTRGFMVAYYLACLAAVYALLVHAARLLSRRATWPARRDVVLLVGSAGVGSTLFFAGSRAYVYHEAILCGAAFALWSVWAGLRWLAAPAEHRWWLLALGLGTLAVHARPPAGLFALAFLGCTAAALLLRGWFARPRPAPAAVRTPLAVGLLAVLGVLSFNALSYLKFASFEGAPLRYHVQYHAGRLAPIAGGNFHLANLPYGFANYAWSPNFVLRPTFPYFYITGLDPAEFPGSRIDLAENTLALPYAMPALVLLAAGAAWLAFTRWPAARLPLALLAAGTAPMALALCAAIAVSQRYTADFVPGLLAAAAIGLAAFPTLPPAPRRLLTAATVTFAVLGALLTIALTLHYQSEVVWGVPDETRQYYHSLRQQFDAFFGNQRS